MLRARIEEQQQRREVLGLEIDLPRLQRGLRDLPRSEVELPFHRVAGVLEHVRVHLRDELVLGERARDADDDRALPRAGGPRDVRGRRCARRPRRQQASATRIGATRRSHGFTTTPAAADGSTSPEEPGAHEGSHGCLTLALDVDHLDRPAPVPMDDVGRPLRDQDLTGLARLLEPAREVHRVAPDVVGELPFADHAGDDRSRRDPTPHPDRVSRRPPHHPGSGDDLERHPDGGVGMVRHRDGRARDGHVRVADRLDLLEAVPVGELVEPAEELVEGVGELLGRGAGGLFGRPDRVDEDHAHVVERLGDPLTGGVLELLDHGLRQDVQQQAVRPRAFLVQFALAQEELAREPFHPVRGERAQHPERDEIQGREHRAHGGDVLGREGVREIHARCRPTWSARRGRTAGEGACT